MAPLLTTQSCTGRAAPEPDPREPHHAPPFRTAVNFIFAEFVVTADADMADLQWHIEHTTAHIVVVVSGESACSLVDAGGFRATERAEEIEREVRSAVMNTEASTEKPALECTPAGPGVFLLTRKGHIGKVRLREQEDKDGLSYARFEVFLLGERAEHTNTAVAVGVVCNHTDQAFPEDFLMRIQTSVKEHDVCFLTGVFGDTEEQMSRFCEAAGAQGNRAICQPWVLEPAVAGEMRGWAEDVEVKACWRVDRSLGCMIYTYPAYMFIFSPLKD